MKIPYHRQKKEYWCGPAALQMAFEFHGKHMSQKSIARLAKTNKRTGTAGRKMTVAVRAAGLLQFRKKNSSLADIKKYLLNKTPVIVNFVEPSWEVAHYALVCKLTPKEIVLNDPWNGRNFKLSLREFVKRWHNKPVTEHRWLMAVYKKGSER
jgi:ABC-type bacteriocin/lantibiotic exporter with double-glycine peptidase domain